MSEVKIDWRRCRRCIASLCSAFRMVHSLFSATYRRPHAALTFTFVTAWSANDSKHFYHHHMMGEATANTAGHAQFMICLATQTKPTQSTAIAITESDTSQRNAQTDRNLHILCVFRRRGDASRVFACIYGWNMYAVVLVTVVSSRILPFRMRFTILYDIHIYANIYSPFNWHLVACVDEANDAVVVCRF